MIPPVSVEIDAQYRALIQDSGFVVEEGHRFFLASGSEAAEYLQGQLTQDVEALTPGETTYSALLDRKGHMQTDMRVTRNAPDELLIDLDEPGADRALRHLSMYKIGREVELTDVSADRTLIRTAGPATPRVLGDVPLAPGSAREIALEGLDLLAIATESGADLVCASGEADRLVAALRSRGAEPVEPEAFELLRIESGRPRFGAEMSERTMPAEAGIVERSVSFTKGCYIGQETVARLHYRGRPNRNLRGLRLESPAQPGTEVTLDGKTIGELGSAAVHPRHGAIALAVLRREAEPGTSVDVGGTAAEVVELPFG
ncbi:folate-binding protein YgfZ [Thermoleophilia bacterium SCSIO 60948]|nr:folate-binding protein YgfZ [Thermoleophilia bacterium SCSIO 60948]